MRPSIFNSAFKSPIQMLSEPLREVFGCGFNVCPIRASSDGHHPFQRIVASCLVFFVMDQTENLGFMGSPIGPVDFDKSFSIAVL
jgi:hypothetical protein